MNLTLDKIAIKHGTDKSTKFHGYTKIYEKVLPVKWAGKLLEIGVLGGASLRMWKEYLPEQWKITGVDIDERCLIHKEENIDIIISDQKMINLHESFDVIIDDGSHCPDDFIPTLKNLWNNLNVGGIYAIEDLSVCKHPKYPVSWNKRFKSFLESEILDFMTDAQNFLDNLENIEIYPKLIIFRKGRGNDCRNNCCTQ